MTEENKDTEGFLESLDGLLSRLPLNDQKTKVGLGLHVLLPFLVGFFPPLLAAKPILDGLSLLLMGVGGFHAAIKGFKK